MKTQGIITIQLFNKLEYNDQLRRHLEQDRNVIQELLILQYCPVEIKG